MITEVKLPEIGSNVEEDFTEGVSLMRRGLELARKLGDNDVLYCQKGGIALIAFEKCAILASKWVVGPLGFEPRTDELKVSGSTFKTAGKLQVSG